MFTSVTGIDLVKTQASSNVARKMQTNTEDQKKLLETCKDFEAIFIKQMLNSMKKTINKSGLLKESMAENIFEDMLYDEYAQKMSRTGGLGIGEMMYRQLSATLDTTKPAEIH